MINLILQNLITGVPWYQDKNVWHDAAGSLKNNWITVVIKEMSLK